MGHKPLDPSEMTKKIWAYVKRKRLASKAKVKDMAQRISLPPEAARGTQMPSGKGWRLVVPSQKKVLKATLITTFKGSDGRFGIFRVVE